MDIDPKNIKNVWATDATKPQILAVQQEYQDEIETIIRMRLEKFLANADLVPRDEFEAVKAMAAEARAEQERLAKRLSVLEKAASKPKSRTAAKTAAVKST